MKTCKYCGKEFGPRANSEICFECLPLGLSPSERRAIKGKLEREKNPLVLICPICKKDFSVPYGEVNRKYCYSCMPKGLNKKEQNMIISREAKKKAVELLGGKCIVCGYNKYMSALDFHHLIEDNKDFNLSHKITSVELSEEVKRELMKCVVLCSNCHRAVHSGEIVLDDSIDNH